ncbi:alpha/beta fold hydrolase [Nonomuraea sp. NPDC049309]|uniref:alpha/beta fold hydrolase n=1 Tax=Nonomuraea sp. NPDC049309 TaxID=3364350 RepID=UPI00371750A1
MPAFSAFDGTTLACHESGSGSPLICLPGGPMQHSGYLEDLGGLTAHRRLVKLDPRGTGDSAAPGDPETYRCDRLVDDVEALRAHLGLDRLTLLGHSAGANLALMYATRHPTRVSALVLVTPSPLAAGIEVTGQERLDVARLRAAEPWFPQACAAFEAIVAGTGAGWDAIDPFFHGRWDDETRRYQASQAAARNDEAAAVFGSAYDPPAIRKAMAALGTPALVVAGEADINTPPVAAARLAALLPGAEQAVLPAAGHFPWRDDPSRFVETIETFLKAAL